LFNDENMAFDEIGYFGDHAIDRIGERLRNSGDDVTALDVHVDSGRASLARRCISSANHLPGALNSRSDGLCATTSSSIFFSQSGMFFSRVGITGNAADYG
jgi:hypothetical protein